MSRALLMELWNLHQQGMAIRDVCSRSGLRMNVLLMEWRTLGLNPNPRSSDPTEDEIKQQCQSLRQTWDPATEMARWVGRKRVDALVG